MTADAFAPHIEAVARHLLGEPNKALSSLNELRFGKQGSVSVDLQNGVWFDHEAGTGGGVLDLVARQTRSSLGSAAKYIRDDMGIVVANDRLPEPPKPSKVVATYDYADEDGEILFQVQRLEPKGFRQRRPDPLGREGWSYKVQGVRQVPYHLHDIFNLEGRGTVYIVEGEKDADKLKAAGMVATCNAGGAGKWPDDLNAWFAGLDVVIIPDNDKAGRNHCDRVGAALVPIAASVRILELPELPPKGDTSDWIAAGNDPRLLPTLPMRPWEPAPPEPPESKFGAITWRELDSVAVRQDWQVADLFFCGDAILVYGASGSGKSFLAVDMGLAIARGTPFLGKATRKGAVLYQAGEGGKGLVKRLKAYRQEHAVAGDVPFVLLPEAVNLFSDPDALETFVEECVAWKNALVTPLALIVIDTFSTASTGANENASEDMGRMLAAGKRIQNATGAGLMWVHHKNAAGDRERGHTSFRANVDSALEVIRDETTGHRTLITRKVKDGEDGEKLGFDLQSVSIGTYDDGKPMTSCVVRPAQVDDTQTSKSKRNLPAGQRNFLTALDAAIRTYGGIMPALNRTPPNTYGVEWHHFQTIYRSMYGSSMDGDAIRQAHKRDGADLIAKGIIDRDHPWTWITEKADEWLR
jgi:hypothetical protein